MTTSPVTPLRSDQQLAAMAPMGPVLIHGGAGTGKTHTIAARIAIALKNGEQPSRIACITHSTGGGRDIMQRVMKFLPGNPSAPRFFSGTTLWFALGLLRFKGAQVLGRSPAFSLWQRDEALELFAVLLGANRRNRRSVYAEAERLWDWYLRAQAGGTDERTPPERAEWIDVVNRYGAEKLHQNAVDRGDVVPLMIQALEKDKQFRATVGRDRLKCLLVDDFQNITPVEYQFLCLLTGPEQGITIAVNPNQGGRMSQGGDDRLLEIFRLGHPRVRDNTVHLTINHRATKVLGKAITRITDDPRMPHLAREDDVFFRTNISVGGRSMPPETPLLRTFEGRPADMYNHILDGSEEFVEQGYALKEIAVVFQDDSILDDMRPLALSRGIPYTVLGGKPRALDRDIRCLTGLLRCLLNPSDFNAFRSGVCVDPHLDHQWLDANVALATRRIAAHENISLAQAARRQSDNPLLDTDARMGLRFFADTHDDLNRMLRDPSTHAYDLCRRAVTLMKEAQGSAHPLEQKAQMERLLGMARVMSRRTDHGRGQHDPRQELLQLCDAIGGEVNVDPLGSENSDPFGLNPGITFTTVEASQGLEWAIVWVVGASDHLLPGTVSPENERKMREAQRHFYVMATRARNLLIFCHAVRSGPTQDAKPSPFLVPIGDILRYEVIPPPAPRR